LCRGTKSEIRNSKFETISNDQNPKFQTGVPAGTGVLAIRAWDFGFVSDLVPGISNFRVAQLGVARDGLISEYQLRRGSSYRHAARGVS
jgi:hypothetical protein